MDNDFITIRSIKITHPSKILFPKSKITKLELVNYYLKVEKLILKELKDRPITLIRSPHGLGGDIQFVQKHPSESFPEYIERVKIKEKDGHTDYYIEIDQIDDILYLLNLGVLEFHTTNSRLSDYEHPDRMIFDLDPDKELDLKHVYKCARDIKAELEERGFKPIIKTSGGKGFHIMVQIKEKMNWDEVHAYAKEIADKLALQNDLYTTVVSKDQRKGKIFIDYLRNSRGATTVAAYSTRAKEGAPISMPIEWKDLEKTKPNQFTIKDFLN